MEPDPVPARVARNLALMQRFVALIEANPSLAGAIPEGASLVIFDADAPAPDDGKEQAAAALEATGKLVWRVTV